MVKKSSKINNLHIMYKKVYIVANDLLDDALTLYKKGSFGSSYYLAQKALEEYEKLNILYAQALRVHNDENIKMEELAVRVTDKNSDDDLGYGIILLIEKDFIKYPPKIDNVLHQPNLKIPDNLEEFKEYILEDSSIINILEAYKLIKSSKVLNESELSKELYYHLHGLKNHILQTNFYKEEFVMPSEILSKEVSKKRLMSVLVLQRIHEITGYHHEPFDLFKFEEGHYKKIVEKLMQ